MTCVGFYLSVPMFLDVLVSRVLVASVRVYTGNSMSVQSAVGLMIEYVHLLQWPCLYYSSLGCSSVLVSMFHCYYGRTMRLEATPQHEAHGRRC